MPDTVSLGFIGCGQMARALARGILGAGAASADNIHGADPVPEARAQFEQDTGAHTRTANLEVAKAASVLILAVKPDQVGPVLDELREAVTGSHLVISIAAGIPLKKIEERLKPGTRVVRVMPNTPALVGASASAYALGTAATAQDAVQTQALLGAVGLAFPVKEPLLDAVTGLSGSGPAYACLVMEALSDGGVGAGLPRAVATQLAAQTLLGAAKMVLETGRHPAVLREAVTSPGGTTAEGLLELERAGVRAALTEAVRAAARKARRLARR